MDSLAAQSNMDFRVFFVNYGSRHELTGPLKELLVQYEFVQYSSYQVQHQPWNKCRALNNVIKELEVDYCLVADIDMIFHPQFVQRLHELASPSRATYFQVGFLPEGETETAKGFSDYKIAHKSTDQATGITLFPVEALRKIRGYDEFYHFWGAEDTDVHIRLHNMGLEVVFYDDQLLMLHQWHPIYRSHDENKLSEDLRVESVVRINHAYMKQLKLVGDRQVNAKGWGEIMEHDWELKSNEAVRIPNYREEIDAFLIGTLPQLPPGIYYFEFYPQDEPAVKRKLKQLAGKKVLPLMEMKVINDRLLMELISHHRHRAYSVKVDNQANKIHFSIQIP